jgi:hypothetical protein
MLIICLRGKNHNDAQDLPFGIHAHGAQEPRHIQKYVEVTSTERHVSGGDSPARRINQRFPKIIQKL